LILRLILMGITSSYLMESVLNFRCDALSWSGLETVRQRPEFHWLKVLRNPSLLILFLNIKTKMLHLFLVEFVKKVVFKKIQHCFAGLKPARFAISERFPPLIMIWHLFIAIVWSYWRSIISIFVISFLPLSKTISLAFKG